MSTNGRPAAGRMQVAADEAKAMLLDDLVGRGQWKGSKFGYVTGLSILTGLMRGIADAAGRSLSRLGFLYRAMTRGEDNSTLPEIEERDDTRRFELAMSTYGKTEADLMTMVSNSYRGFYFYGALLIIVLVLGIGSLRHGNISGLPTFLDVLLRFATVPALAALMLRFGYLNWMVRNRHLANIGAYLRSGDLFPAKTLARVAVLIAAFTVLAPNVAFAEIKPSDIFGDPSKDDVFFNMLGYVVPGIGPVTGFETNAHKAVATGFLVFSAALMFIGSLMLSWHVLSGIVASAYSGKVLGERWHQIWAPGRVVLGLGSLAPVAGGFGAAQVLVVYLIVWGGNLANVIWTPYVTALGAGIQGTSVSLPVNDTSDYARTRRELAARLAGAEDVIYQIARREICNATANKFIEENYSGSWFTGGDRSQVNPNPEWKVTESITNVWNSYKSYVAYQFSWLRSGSETDPVISPVTHSIDYGSLCGSISVEVNRLLGAVDSKSVLAAHAAAAQRFDEARLAAVQSAVEAIRPMAKKIAATYNNGGETSYAFDETKPDTRDLRNTFAAVLKAQTDQYRDKMTKAADEQIKALDVTAGSGQSLVKSLVEEASQKGWATAGAYYVTLAQVQSASYAKAMSKPNMEDMSLSNSSKVSPHMLKTLVGTETDRGAVTGFDAWWSRVVRTEFSPVDLDSVKAGRMNQNADSAWNSLMNWLGTDGMLVGMLNLFKDMNPFNPMKSMIDFGHAILTVFYMAMAVIAGASILSSFVGAGLIGNLGSSLLQKVTSFASPSLGQLGGVLVGFLGMLTIAIFAVGVVHAYIIPMVPYMHVLFFIMGMMVLLVEALIAAPLWAFFHVRMDGHELIDQVQRPGYMIAFNLMLRPALMILGLMMSLFVFGAMAWFISHTFVLAAVAAGGEHSVGPIGTIVMLCIMTYLHYQIALRSFGLINQVPDRVMRWFGQGGENLGEEHENRAALAFAVGNVQHRTEALLRTGGIGASARSSVGGMHNVGNAVRGTVNKTVK